MRFSLFLFFLLVPFRLFAQPPAVAVGSDSVSIAVPPGSRVALFGVVRAATGYSNHVRVVHTSLVDDDNDGVIVFSDGKPIAVRSIWAAVDVGSGEAGIGLPPGYVPAPKRFTFSDEQLLKDSKGDRALLRDTREFLHLLIVRPGVGVWAWKGSDGGKADSDRLDDHRIHAHLRDFTTVWRQEESGTDHPTGFRPGDLIIGIDPRLMQYYVGAAR